MIDRVFAVLFYGAAAGLAVYAVIIFEQGSPMTLGMGGASSVIMLFGAAMLTAAGNHAWRQGR